MQPLFSPQLNLSKYLHDPSRTLVRLDGHRLRKWEERRMRLMQRRNYEEERSTNHFATSMVRAHLAHLHSFARVPFPMRKDLIS